MINTWTHCLTSLLLPGIAVSLKGRCHGIGMDWLALSPITPSRGQPSRLQAAISNKLTYDQWYIYHSLGTHARENSPLQNLKLNQDSQILKFFCCCLQIAMKTTGKMCVLSPPLVVGSQRLTTYNCYQLLRAWWQMSVYKSKGSNPAECV